jgi:DNA polymerase I-like protein with 3'-5' exonuclease and polymerase domains
VLYKELAESAGLVLRAVTLIEPEKCRCTSKLRSACVVCAGSGIIPAGVVEFRWATPVEFNPNSALQKKRYMRFRKHAVPKHAKRTDASGEASETTDVKELERLFAKTHDPIYPMWIEKSQLTKIKGTYVEGWQPGRDGRIHTTFTMKPATLQLSSREPNVQNGIKHGKNENQLRLAKAFAAMQCAESGHLMVNFDFKSFHAQTLACEAGDPDYLRLAKIDVHSFVTCHFVKYPKRDELWGMSDAALRELFKELKQDEGFKFIRDFKAKRAILGLGLGMGARKLYQMNLEDFANEAEAKKLMELILIGLFPKLKKYQNEIRAKAAEQGYLQNKYGTLRRFYDCQRWDRKQQKFVSGDQAEAAVAYLPASSAFGHMRDVMHRIREKGWDERYQLVNTIHDSLVFHCPKELVEECVESVGAEMEKPSTVLIYPKCAPGGLSVEVEAMVGRDLAHMEEYHN